jgi:hypothetical protein
MNATGLSLVSCPWLVIMCSLYNVRKKSYKWMLILVRLSACVHPSACLSVFFNSRTTWGIFTKFDICIKLMEPLQIHIFQYPIYLSIWLSVCLCPSVRPSIRSSLRPSIHLSVCLSVCVWLYSPLLNLGHFFSFLILFTVGRTPMTGDQPVARPPPIHRTTQTE